MNSIMMFRFTRGRWFNLSIVVWIIAVLPCWGEAIPIDLTPDSKESVNYGIEVGFSFEHDYFNLCEVAVSVQTNVLKTGRRSIDLVIVNKSHRIATISVATEDSLSLGKPCILTKNVYIFQLQREYVDESWCGLDIGDKYYTLVLGKWKAKAPTKAVTNVLQNAMGRERLDNRLLLEYLERRRPD